MSVEIKTLSPADVVVYHASRPSRKRRQRKTELSENPAPREIAAFYADQYTVESIHKALQWKGKTVDLEWLAKKMLDMLHSSKASFAVKIQVIDRLEKWILLGAIQDTKVFSSIKLARQRKIVTVSKDSKGQEVVESSPTSEADPILQLVNNKVS